MKDIQELEIGDFVRISTRHGFGKYKVERLTKTQIVTTNGKKFNRSNGRSVGTDIWNTSYLSVWSDDDEIELKEKRRIFRNKKVLEKVNNINSEHLTDVERVMLEKLIEKYNED